MAARRGRGGYCRHLQRCLLAPPALRPCVLTGDNPLLQDVGAALSRECPGGLDIVYEGVGGALRHTLLSHLAPNGRLLQVCAFWRSLHACPPAPAPQLQRDDISRAS